MLSFSGSLRVFVAVEPCDMRKVYEGLSALAGEVLGEDVRSGAIFVFGNIRPNSGRWLSKLVQGETTMKLDWIRQRLAMGDRSYCWRLIRRTRHQLSQERRWLEADPYVSARSSARASARPAMSSLASFG